MTLAGACLVLLPFTGTTGFAGNVDGWDGRRVATVWITVSVVDTRVDVGFLAAVRFADRDSAFLLFELGPRDGLFLVRGVPNVAMLASAAFRASSRRRDSSDRRSNPAENSLARICDQTKRQRCHTHPDMEYRHTFVRHVHQVTLGIGVGQSDLHVCLCVCERRGRRWGRRGYRVH